VSQTSNSSHARAELVAIAQTACAPDSAERELIMSRWPGSAPPMMGHPRSSGGRRVPAACRPSPEPGDNGRAPATSRTMRRPVRGPE